MHEVNIFVVFRKLKSHYSTTQFPFLSLLWVMGQERKHERKARGSVSQNLGKVLKYEQIMTGLFLLEVFTDKLTTK